MNHQEGRHDQNRQREVFLPSSPQVLSALRRIADSQGRQFQAVLDEALRDYIDRQRKERPRCHVMASFASSLDEFDTLHHELAK